MSLTASSWPGEESAHGRRLPGWNADSGKRDQSALGADHIVLQEDSRRCRQSGSATTGLASNDYSVQAPFTDNADKGDLRLDYQQNPSSSWFLRISDRKENAVNYPTIPIPLDGQTNGNIRILDQQIALGYTHLMGANKIVDARLGLSRTKAGKYNLSIGDTAFAIPGLPSNPIVAGGLPSIGINGFTGFGRQSTNPQWQNPALLDPKVNFTWVRGNHSLKFGYEYEHIWMAVNDNNPLYGSFTYGGGYSAVRNSPVSRQLLGGLPLRHNELLLAGQLLRRAPSPDDAQRLRAG